MELNLNESLKEAALKVVADNEEPFFGMKSEQTSLLVCEVIVDGLRYQVHITATLDEDEFMDVDGIPVIDYETKELV